MKEDIIVTEGEAKDQILEYSLTKFEKHINAHEIQKEVFPNSSVRQVRLWMEGIKRSNPDIAEIGSNEDNCLITSTPLTKTFLNNGGFTKLEKDKEKQKAHEKELAEIEFKKSKIDLELAEKMLKEYPWTKWFARIGFFIAVCLGVLELIKLLGILPSQ